MILFFPFMFFLIYYLYSLYFVTITIVSGNIANVFSAIVGRQTALCEYVYGQQL